MSIPRICLFFAFTTIMVLFSIDSVVADNVMVLTGENFEKEVGQDRDVFILYCAPGSFYCDKDLMTEYEKLGEIFKSNNSILIGKVNCLENKSICRKYGIFGFPIMQWFPKGSLEPIWYKKPERTSEALAEYINTGVKIPHNENDTNGRRIVIKLQHRTIKDGGLQQLTNMEGQAREE